METITIKEVQLKLINRMDVSTNEYKPLDREPIIIKETDGTMSIVIGDGVNLIKDLKTSTSADLSKYTLLTDFNAHKDSSSNPHSVTKEQLGLGNVNNTSDADKPISTATQTELGKKIELLGNEAVSGQPYHFPYHLAINVNENDFKVKAYTITLDNSKTLTDYDFALPLATDTTAGLMSKDDAYILHNLGDVYQLVSNLQTSIPTTPRDDKYLSTKAVKTELDNKVSLLGTEAISGEQYHLPYHATFNALEDSIEITAYTITLDNTKTLKNYKFTLPSATSSTAGLMSKADKTKLDGIDFSIYELLNNKVSSWQATPDDTHYPSEKLTKDSLDLKEDKLPTYIKDKYLHCYEDTTGTTPELKLEWVNVGATSSQIGDIIHSSALDTLDKVISERGGTFWLLLNHDTNYYEWWRTDTVPTTTYSSYVGKRIFNQLTKSMIEDPSFPSYQFGYEWKLIADTSGLHQFSCIDNTGYKNPWDTGFVKEDLFNGDYVSVNIEKKEITDETYFTSSTDILAGGILLSHIDTATSAVVYKLTDGVNTVAALTQFGTETAFIPIVKDYLSTIYNVPSTDWIILSSGILDSVIQAQANHTSTISTPANSYVTQVIINNATTVAEMQTRYGTATLWTKLNTPSGTELTQWIRDH